MQPIRREWLFVGIILLMASTPAYADAGVPMLYLVWPASWILFVPIVLVEAAVARTLLRLATLRALLVSAVSNAASTLVGIPLTWLLLAVLEILATSGGRAYGLNTWPRKVLAFTVQAPWLIPYESDLDWLIPAAAIVLCVPFFFTSVGIEYLVARRLVRDVPTGTTSKWSWRANLLSYSLIVLGLVVVLVRAVLQHPRV